MATIITRAGKGSPLTNTEVDANFTNLDTYIDQRTNPLAQAIRVAMTASTTAGSIQLLNNANLNFGTNNFTVEHTDVVVGGAIHAFFVKRQDADNRVYWFVAADGIMNFAAFVAGATIISFSTASISAYYGQCAKYSVSIIRETATSAGSYVVYINGVVFASGSIASAATVSISNTGTEYINASNVGATAATTRVASNFISQLQYNRALSAAEVLSLCVNGAALADIGASQTNLITGDSSNFEGGTLGSWVANSVAPTSLAVNTVSPLAGADDLLCSSTTNTNSGFNLNIGTTRAGVRYRIQFIYKAEAGSSWSVSLRETTSGTSAIPATTTLSGSTTITSDGTLREFFWEFQPTATTSNTRLLFKNGAGAIQSIQADNFDYKVIGITGQWNAENAQSNIGQIFDTSGNKNHALLPAAGATIIGRPTSQQRQVRWTNTWAGTNELQYIGGVNQAILPANAYIESIVGTVSGATPHDIIIGDGSDTDRYVTITTGLAAGTTTFTLASRVTDGTNLKLTVDPDTDATMSIAWVITYTTLES